MSKKSLSKDRGSPRESEENQKTEEILSNILSCLNEGSKIPLAYNLMLDDMPAKAKFWISTGCSVLDIILANNIMNNINEKDVGPGGFPTGRFIMLESLEGSGKSLLVAHALAQVQKMGGVAALIDTENAIDINFLRAIGVDLSKLVYVQTQDIMKVFSVVRKIIHVVNSPSPANIPIVIAIDSITSPHLRESLDLGEEFAGYAAAKKAAYVSDQLSKLIEEVSLEDVCLIYTVQLRSKINPMPNEDPLESTGGHALKYYASIIVRLKQKSLIKHSSSNFPLGVVLEAHVKKSRLGPAHRKVQFSVLYDRGIDDVRTTIETATSLSIVKSESGKAYRSYVSDSGEEYKFTLAKASSVLPKHILNEILYKIADYYKFKYIHQINEDQDSYITNTSIYE